MAPSQGIFYIFSGRHHGDLDEVHTRKGCYLCKQDGNSSNGPAAKLSTLPIAYWIPIIMTKRMADDQHQKADLSEAAKLLLLLWSYAPKNFRAQD